VRPDSGKCLHYYFYFIDAELGLVYLRVPTWAPFRLLAAEALANLYFDIEDSADSRPVL
jgi:hypothetical protein